MNGSSSNRGPWLAVLAVALCLALALWGWRARRGSARVGRSMAERLAEDWPQGRPPRGPLRSSLLSAADAMARGQWQAAAVALGDSRDLSPRERRAAARWLEQHAALAARFVAAASASRGREQAGEDVAWSREALRRVLVAASSRDEAKVHARLQDAEAALNPAPALATALAGQAGVAALAAHVGPAFLLGRELMAEGHGTVAPLVTRAAAFVRSGDFDRALPLLDLAAQLLDLGPAGGTIGEMPRWFAALDGFQLPPADAAQTDAAVALCRATAMAEEPSRAVTRLIARASVELAAGRHSEAHWWAGIALRAMGIQPQAAADRGGGGS